jgi:hypothetical protein
MNKQITLLVVAFSLNLPQAVAQAPTPPPDFYNDMQRSGFGFWENKGQVKDTGGNLRPDVQFVTGVPRRVPTSVRKPPSPSCSRV